MGFRDKIEYYDIQVNLTLNPVNWELNHTHYYKGCRQLRFGPISITLFYGGH